MENGKSNGNGRWRELSLTLFGVVCSLLLMVVTFEKADLKREIIANQELIKQIVALNQENIVVIKEAVLRGTSERNALSDLSKTILAKAEGNMITLNRISDRLK